jgi:hypothetical protein
VGSASIRSIITVDLKQLQISYPGANALGKQEKGIVDFQNMTDPVLESSIEYGVKSYRVDFGIY